MKALQDILRHVHMGGGQMGRLKGLQVEECHPHVCILETAICLQLGGRTGEGQARRQEP